MMGHHQTYFCLITFTLLYIELSKCVLTSNVAGESGADLSSSFTGVQLRAPLGGPLVYHTSFSRVNAHFLCAEQRSL